MAHRRAFLGVLGLLVLTNTSCMRHGPTAPDNPTFGPPLQNVWSTHPSWGANGLIAYDHWSRHDSSGIWTVAPDGSERALLFSGGSDPTWSPDCKHLAVMVDVGIAVLSREGNVQYVRQTGWSATPTWSPDGSRIAFYEVCCDTRGIWAMRSSDGGDLTLVAPGADSPAWSPDGLWLACIRPIHTGYQICGSSRFSVESGS